MRQFPLAIELLAPGESALVLRTDGRGLTDNHNGTGSTGWWRIGPKRSFDTVIIFRQASKDGADNDVFIGKRDRVEGPIKNTGYRGVRYLVHLHDFKHAGQTFSNWRTFADTHQNPTRFITRPIDSSASDNLDVDIHTVEATEGHRRLVLHLRRERNQAIVRAKKKRAASLNCEVCTFSFGRYGRAASHYCEVHHLLPLSEVERTIQTRMEDLAIVCANCHRVIHLRNPSYLLDEVRRMLAK